MNERREIQMFVAAIEECAGADRLMLGECIFMEKHECKV